MVLRALKDARIIGQSASETWLKTGAVRCGMTTAHQRSTCSSGMELERTTNVCFWPVQISPRGGLVICQDSEGEHQHLYGLSADGRLFTFARSTTQLNGEQGFAGDFSDSEWAGSCFSPDGKWLFANVQSPGYSVAITGPWQRGLI